MQQYWLQLRQFIVERLLHADDPPHRLALGMAVGVFIAFTPTVGFQMMLAVFLAWLLGANKVVAAAVVWISNPATLVPIYYTCFVVGRSILGYEPMGQEWWGELSNPPSGWWPAVQFYWSRFLEIATPLWAGGALVGLLLAYPSYYVVYHLVRWYRLRRWGQLTPPRHGRTTAAAADSELTRTP